MGGWAKHEDAVYLVSWDEQGIVKIGTSGCQRWRRFLLRGGRLVGLWTFGIAAYEREWAAHVEASRRWPKAFAALPEARGYLGVDGGGWRECYLAPAADACALLEQMLGHCSSTCVSTRPSNALGAYATDGRTD